MKRFAFLGAILMSYVIVGCDMGSTQPKKLTIAEMIANGKEEAGSQCTKGDVSLNCEFLSGDLTGTGKWHHTKVYISKSGNVDVSIDGEKFRKTSTDSTFSAGTNYALFDFESASGKKATVTISNSNDGSDISLEAFDKNGKKILIANR
ncbi:hypothetical protein IGC89_000180 [Escherichia coli]|nr:hypothetical protein [Escherichia coli]EFM4248476.1 hypothetical protein [Escherichia coli]EGI3121327.1 hypothetical protein [Escherichia coli]EGI3126624.1 hypothetical protein [Escherichia coli]EGI3140234.1 hypothetical protein [Escherichia coli]